MTRAIREHARDFIAVAALTVIALVTGWIILQNQRLRVPVLEERPFQLKAELSTAQSVTPGQGQTVRVAGVRIGDISKVELEGDRAVVTMDIDTKFLPIYRDATVLLRPKTGLKDMFMELDPGSRVAGEAPEDFTIPVQNTAPDINLDEILELLDADTRAYLQMLLIGGGQGLKGRGKDLGAVLASLGPINRSLARLNSRVAERKEALARLIHNLSILTGRIGSEDQKVSDLIRESNEALGAIASQDLNVREATRLLGPTLAQARVTLTDVADYAGILGPTLGDLRPFARRLDDINRTLLRLAKSAKPQLKHHIRPFVRAARRPVRDLKPAADQLVIATPSLTNLAAKLNKLGNMAAYNPNGAENPLPVGDSGRDEGYLYWLAWLGHNGTSVFQNQDAHGLYRRIYLSMPCDAAGALLKQGPLMDLITDLEFLFGPGGFCAPQP